VLNLAIKCPRCGYDLRVQKVTPISDENLQLTLVCTNCGQIFEIIVAKKDVPVEKVKGERLVAPISRIDEDKLPFDTPSILKVFVGKRDANFVPFFVKKVMDKPPKKSVNLSVDYLVSLGIERGYAERLYKYFISRGINRLYVYQERAFKSILDGENVLIVAPTGTGKTEAFCIPAMMKSVLYKRHGLKRPYVLITYPTKALARDQERKLETYATIFDLRIGVLDGDTPQSRRAKILANPPDILITNFDMINYHLSKRTPIGLLFTNANMLIIDEAHEYYGAFGTHIFFIIKRLKRLVEKSNRELQIVMSSATIANPQEFAKMFIGEQFVLVQESGRRVPLYIMFVYPLDTIFRTISYLIAISIQHDVKTLAFLNTRKSAELTLYVLNRISKKMPEIKNKFDVHRAGLSKKIRQQIEDEFKRGLKRALISTPTLELGIDIGDLDLVISEITPIDNFIQRSGRAGRRGQPGSAILVLRTDDPISNYYAKRPDEYFTDVSLKYIEPNNPYIAMSHIYLAAYDSPLMEEEIRMFNVGDRIIKELLEKGSLVKINNKFYANKTHFHNYFSTNIRGSDKIVKVYFEDKIIDEREALIAIRELHPGAIYINRGRKYLVTNLDLKRLKADVVDAGPQYDQLYTKPLYTYSAEPKMILKERDIFGTKLFYGLFRMKAIVHEYLIFREGYDKPISERELDEPILYEFDTYAIAFKAPRVSLLDMDTVAGSYHATEHILIEGTNAISGGGSEDLGGISFGTTGIIVIYDGTPGGNGVSNLLFQRFDKAVNRAVDILESCKADDIEKFNKCVYSYRCGNNNRPLYAPGALEILTKMKQNYRVEKADETIELLNILDRGYV